MKHVGQMSIIPTHAGRCKILGPELLGKQYCSNGVELKMEAANRN